MAVLPASFDAAAAALLRISLACLLYSAGAVYVVVLFSDALVFGDENESVASTRTQDLPTWPYAHHHHRRRPSSSGAS